MLGEKRALPGHQHWQLGAWLSIPVSSNWCSFYLFYLLGGSWHTSLLQSMPHFLLPCGHPFHISRASLREDISGNGQNSHLPTSFFVTLGYPLIFQLSRPTFLNSWGQNLAKRREKNQTDKTIQSRRCYLIEAEEEVADRGWETEHGTDKKYELQ